MRRHFFTYYSQESKIKPDHLIRKYVVRPADPREPQTVKEALTIAQLCASKDTSLTTLFLPTDNPVIKAKEKPADPKPADPKPADLKPATEPVMNRNA